jgi:hypothetical protein
MAKPDNPAEAPVSALPPRPAQRVGLHASPEGNVSVDGRERNVSFDARHSLDEGDSGEPRLAGRGGRASRELIDDAFDTTRNLAPLYLEAPAHLEAPDAFLADSSLEDLFEVEGAIIEAEGGGHDDTGHDDTGHDDTGHDDFGQDGFSQDDSGLYEGHGAHDDAGHDADGAYADDATRLTPGRAAVAPRVPNAEPRPGLAWARRPGPAALDPASGFAAAPSPRVPKFPVANLERPSTSRLELTPSPVPRVALAPATGAVDISLVPGPHTVGSRNLPTLAAQHLVGRRAARRPAPALTVPPPAARESRAAFTLARDVRSSKGEIVLGLTIGLGVSLLLAGLGQAYLRSDPIAEAPSAPAQLESVTLSARPEAAAANAGAEAAADEGVASGAAGTASARGAATGAERSTPARSRNAAAAPKGGSVADDSMVLARAAGPKRSERTPQRATAARAPRSQAAAASNLASGHAPIDSRGAAGSPAAVSAAAVSPAAVSPAAVSPAAVSPAAAASAPSLVPPSEPPAAATPLTPAESAGLGLDLPL